LHNVITVRTKEILRKFYQITKEDTRPNLKVYRLQAKDESEER